MKKKRILSLALILICISCVACNKKIISKEEAQKIALNHAKLNRKDVSFMTTHLEHEDGYKVYNVEFKYDSSEYEYSIDAKNGAIIEFDISNDMY